MSEKQNEGKTRAETCHCPFCLTRRFLDEGKERHEEFFTHLNQARIEVLLACKSLLEKRISRLQKGKKKVTRVKVD